jgi:hypothetical protein
MEPIKYLVNDSYYLFFFHIIAIICIFFSGEVVKLESNSFKKFLKSQYYRNDIS